MHSLLYLAFLLPYIHVPACSLFLSFFLPFLLSPFPPLFFHTCISFPLSSPLSHLVSDQSHDANSCQNVLSAYCLLWNFVSVRCSIRVVRLTQMPHEHVHVRTGRESKRKKSINIINDTKRELERTKTLHCRR